MTSIPSLGVVVPVKNCRPLLERHLEGLAKWIDLAEEVVVVDSHSNDGSGEFVRHHLNHPRVRLLQHPPGLYASWNHGIEALTTEHGYLATVADRISREGVIHLRECLSRLDTDVVLSKPEFEDETGRKVEVEWPIDDIVTSLGLTVPRALSRLEAVSFALRHAEEAMSGSWASNLFRTSALRARPFPTEFGYAGDGVWSLRHAADVRWAVTPLCLSRFQVHAGQPTVTERRSTPSAATWGGLAMTMIREGEERGLLKAAVLEESGIEDLGNAKQDHLQWQERYDRHRSGKVPWSLNPVAWLARARRNSARRLVERRKQTTLRWLVAEHAGTA